MFFRFSLRNITFWSEEIIKLVGCLPQIHEAPAAVHKNRI